jgi:hypothetical protein
MTSILSKTDILRKFKDNLIKFLEALIEQFPNESDFYLLRILINESSTETTMCSVGRAIVPYSDMVLEKNEKFFLEECGKILRSIPGVNIENNKIDHFKQIWLSPVLTLEDREQIWRWFKVFLKLSKEYQKYNYNFVCSSQKC